MKHTTIFTLDPWRELALLMMILMEVSWVTPWFRSLTPETYAASSWRVFTVISGFVFFSHVLVRLMDHLRLKRNIRQGLMIIFLTVGIFVGIKTLLYSYESVPISELINRPVRSLTDLKTIIPVEFLVAITIVFSFWRGLTLAQDHVGPSAVMEHFWLGIVMYVLFVLLNTIVTGESPADFFYLFLFASLIAMSSARLTIVGIFRGGRVNKPSVFWVTGIFLAAMVVTGLSFLIGETFGDQFSIIGSLILAIIGSVLIFFVFLINPFISLLLKLLSNLFQNSDGISNFGNYLDNLNALLQGANLKISELIGNSTIGRFISSAAPTLKAILLTSVIVLITLGFILWMAISLWRNRERYQIGDEGTTLTGGNFANLLLAMLRNKWNGAINSLGQAVDFRHRQRARAAARIRQIYTDLMDLCDSLGFPRHEAVTPLEFIPQLDGLFPQYYEANRSITEAYNRVRYGLLPETRQEVEEVETAWRILQEAGKEAQGEKQHIKKK